MKLTAAREDFLAPLQSVIGVVERRQTMPVLANVLLSARDNRLSITGTDLEVELVATRQVSVQQSGDITIPGRKLLDIFKSLPEKTSVTLSTEGERVSIRGGRSRFTLSSLPATDFPVIEEINAQQTLTLEQGEFRRLIDTVQWQIFVPVFCQPVWEWFTAQAWAAGRLRSPTIPVQWSPPRFEAVDPLKDAMADMLAMRSGTMTLAQAIARQGHNPDAVLAEIAAMNAKLDALGLVLDSDPRKVTKTGVLQDAINASAEAAPGQQQG